jgi:cytochrome c6
MSKSETDRGAKWRVKGACAFLLGAGVALGASAVHGADMANGARVYNTHCAGCHGADGRSMNPAAPNLVGGAKTMQADMVLLMRIKSGKGQCPPYLGILKDKDILDVLAHTRTLR